MKAVKAIFQNGKIKFTEKPAETGPVEVLVVFPEAVDDPWQEILNEETPRPGFLKFAEECQAEIKQGKSKPLKFGQL